MRRWRSALAWRLLRVRQARVAEIPPDRSPALGDLILRAWRSDNGTGGWGGRWELSCMETGTRYRDRDGCRLLLLPCPGRARRQQL